MASHEVLDFALLLAPIPGANPAGAPLRDDFSPQSVYRRIKDARAAARAAERNVTWDDEKDLSQQRTKAEWQPVIDLSQKAIAELSKDLEVASWFTEALMREYGYAGLRDGFHLLRALVELFWDNLYPLPDEDGVLARVASIAGLNGDDSEGVLINPIANVPITATGSDRPYTLADYRQALDLDRVTDPDKRSQRMAQGAISLQMFERAVRETPPETLRDATEDIAQCSEEFEKLCAALEEKCGRDQSGFSLAPPSSNIRGALAAASDQLRTIAKDTIASQVAGEVVEDSSDGAMVPVAAGRDAIAGRVQTREDAFRALLQVADFFKRTEPHSPVSYALEQAVRWGRMSLPDLLTELIAEPASREQVFKLMGIKQPESHQ
jgi:type VI secretion system protein ImpA